jgi:hypothetical protein
MCIQIYEAYVFLESYPQIAHYVYANTPKILKKPKPETLLVSDILDKGYLTCGGKIRLSMDRTFIKAT